HQLKVNGHVQTGAYPIEWRAFLAAHPQVREFSRYEEVAAGLDDDRGDAEPMSARQTFLDTPPAKRRAVMIGMLKEEVAKVLRTSVARIREDRPLTQMGLDSLMSFELLMRIESMFDLSRPPTRVNPETTLVDLGISLLELVAGGGEADLAAVSLRGGTAASGGATDPATLPLPDGCLVDLRKAGDWSPLFAFHPAGGSIKVFDPFVAALPEECPFTGVQTRVFFAPGGEFLTLEGMARSYARAIMRRQPEGPIKLLGFAFGSHTAVAVAAELERVGREVSWIGQIDPIDQVFQPGMKNDQEVIDWHIRDFARMRGAETVDGVVIDEDVRDMVEAIIGRVGRRSIEERAGWLADWHRDKRFMRRGTEERVGELVLTLHFHHTDLARGRGQVEIESPVEVWRGSHRWANAAGDLLISRGGITEHRMPIDHSEFFTGGNPAILAERIKASLEEIESKTARG
ncbi:MAG: thioesterase domain-containing protein, partial [Candidatus Nanopelagicales bacterium]